MFRKLPLIDARKIIRDRFAEILGILSVKRFGEISQKFFALFEKTKYDIPSLVYGMKYLKIQLDSPQNIGKSVKFMQTIFELKKLKKSEFKIIMYEVLANMLSPLAGFEYKNLDYTDWFSIINQFLIFSKEKVKQKYYSSLYPFFSSLVSLRYDESLLEYLHPLCDNLLKFLNQKKNLRLMAIDCMIHILGFYLKVSVQQEDNKLKEIVMDKLNKFCNPQNGLLSFGKKVLPKEENLDQYDSIVDLILMVSDTHIETAVNSLIIECLKFEGNLVITENVYIGLRAFMTLAEKYDIDRISPIMEEDKKTVKYPSWVLKLMLKSEKIKNVGTFKNDTEFEPERTILASPFSSFNSAGRLSTNQTFLNHKESGLHNFENELSKVFSNVLKELDKQLGIFTIGSQKGNITEIFPKEKGFYFTVFATALGCLPQLLPNGYTSYELTEVLGRCSIHQSKEIRDISWSVLLHLMEFHVSLRPAIIHSLCELALSTNDFKVNLLEGILSRLVHLLSKWSEFLLKKRKEDQGPSTYAKLNQKEKEKEKFSIPKVESTALVMLCNIFESVRIYAIQMIIWTKKTATILFEQKEIDELPTTLEDIFEETEKQIIERTADKISKKYNSKKLLYKNIDEMQRSLKGDYSFLLHEIAILSSNFCNTSSKLAIPKIMKRITSIGIIDLSTKLVTIADNENLEFWKNLITFSSATVFGDNLQRDIKKSQTNLQGDNLNPRDLLNNILLHLKTSIDSQMNAAIHVLGTIHEDLYEVLFEELADYEANAYLENRKIPKKTKQSFRHSIVRIYSKLAEEITNAKFKEKDLIKDKFLSFINEQLNHLKQTNNLYNIELQVLRFYFFKCVNSIIKKFFYYPFKENTKGIDSKLREDLIKFVINWTGIGEESKKREQQELQAFELFIKPLKEEERAQNESNFKKTNTKTQEMAISALVSLLLGKINEFNIHEIKQWSMKTRIKMKSIEHEKVNMAERKSENLEHRKPVIQQINLNLPFFRKSDTLMTYRPNSKSGDLKEEISFGVYLFQWIDSLIANGNKDQCDLGIEAISNLIEANEEFLEIAIDQCYHCSTIISYCYFSAIYNIIQHTDLPISLASMLSLILFGLRSPMKEIRDISLSMINILTNLFNGFDNYPYLISGDIPDSNDILFMEISKKLSKDHASLSNELVKEIFTRLSYISHIQQSSLLTSLEHWVENIDFKLPNILKVNDQEVDERDVIISCLFDITFSYGDEFPTEIKNFWIKLGQKSTNIPAILVFLINKSSKIENSSSILQISQKITRLLTLASPDPTIQFLMEEMVKYKSFSINDHDDISDGIQIEDKLPLFSHHEVAFVLLLGITYEKRENLATFLPIILHFTFLHMDHPFPTISETAKIIIMNLVHKFVISQLPHDKPSVSQKEQIQSAQEIIQFIQNKKGIPLWRNDIENQMIYSMETITYLVESCIKVFEKEHKLKQRWGSEALKYATKNKIPHVVIRSLQIYRVIKPPITSIDIIEFGQCIKYFLTTPYERKSNSEGGTNSNTLTLKTRQSESGPRPSSDSLSPSNIPLPPNIVLPIYGFGFASLNDPLAREKVTLNEIICTLREVFKSIDKKRFILYPQLFWLIISLLHTDYIVLYRNALTLVLEMFEKIDIHDFCTQNILLANCPQIKDSYQGIQSLIIRGLYHKDSEPLSIQVLADIARLPCDTLFSTSGNRILMNILSLLPFLCNHLSDELQKKCFKIAINIAESCEHLHKKIAKVFLRYSKGHYTTPEKFLSELRKPLSESFFTNFEEEIFLFLQKLLEYGPTEYQKSIILIIHSLSLYIDMTKTNIYQKDQFTLVNSLLNMLNTPLWQDVARVMDVAVKMSSKGNKIKLIPNSTSNQLLSKRSVEFNHQSGEGNKKLIEMIELIESTIEMEKMDINTLKTARINDQRLVLENDHILDDSDESSEGVTNDNTESDSTIKIAIMSNIDEKEENYIKKFQEQLKKQLNNFTCTSPYPKMNDK